MMGGFLFFFLHEITPPIDSSTRIWVFSLNKVVSSTRLVDFPLFSYFFCHRLVAVCGCLLLCSLVFVWAIQTATVLQSNREVTSNPYLLVCFIRPRILGILGILGLFLYRP